MIWIVQFLAVFAWYLLPQAADIPWWVVFSPIIAWTVVMISLLTFAFIAAWKQQ